MQVKDRLEEWKKWYFHHKDTDMDIEKRLEFLQKCLEGQYELLDALIQSQAGKKSSVLYTPRGLAYVP